MPVFKYIKGDPDNIVADTISRLSFLEKKKGYPLTIALSNGDTTTKPAVMMAEEVEELWKVSYEDLFINYPANLMNFPL